MKRAVCLAMVSLFAAAPFARAETLTLDRLKSAYSGQKGLDADIIQTKTSRYLAKPLKSRVHLTVNDETIRWEVKAPVVSTVVFDPRGAHFFDDKGHEDVGAKLPEGPKTEALVGFLKALITVDFPKLERDFDLQVSGQDLIATPRAGGTSIPIKELRLVFDASLKLTSLTVAADSETTAIEFTRLELKK